MDFLQFHARMASLPLPARLDTSASLGLQMLGREIPGLPSSPNRVSPTHGRASPRPVISMTESCLPTLALNSGLNTMNCMQTIKHGSLKLPPYSSPPPTANNPEHNVCKLVEFRGAKIAAFTVDNRELICLPQAFELFLKHLVGGLHTVYTKLKRLEIIPVVCNVEQVRILRGLGAIQPGVNRCKLISCAEFEILYDDCTNSSARPGRPAKRVNSVYSVQSDVLESLKRRREEISADPGYNQIIYDRDQHMPAAQGVPGYPTITHFSNLFSMHHIMQPMALRHHLDMRPAGGCSQTDSGATAARRISPRSDGEILPMLGMYNTSGMDTRLPHCLPASEQCNRPLNLQTKGYEKEESRVPSSDDDDDECNVDDDVVSDEDKRDKCTDDSSNSQCYSNSKVTDRSSVSAMNAHLLSLIGDQRFSDFDSVVTTFNTVVRSVVDAARTAERRVNEEKDQICVELVRERERCLELETEMRAERRKREFFQRRSRRLRRAMGCEAMTVAYRETEQVDIESSSGQMIVCTQALCSESENDDLIATYASHQDDGATEEKPAHSRAAMEATNRPIRLTHPYGAVNVLHHAGLSSPADL